MIAHRSIRPFDVGSRWIRAILREIALSWHFNKYDISTTIMPGLQFTLAAWHLSSPEWPALPGVILKSALYFWLYACVFCYSNQIAGIQEDRLNKPNRPLVTGMVSLQGAWVRWLVIMVLYDLVSWWLGVLEWAILWQIILVLHNFGGWARHWFSKNLAMSLALIAELAAGWQLVGPITPDAWRWILFLAVILFPCVILQDLRDMKGDQANRRKTFPLVFGENFTCYFVALCFGLLPFGVHWILMAPAGLRPDVLACDLLLGVLSFVIAFRAFYYRTPMAHHRSYVLFTYWYCAALASAIVVL